MKEIPLTQGFVALVDDEDYSFLMNYKWCISGCKRYAVSRENGKEIKMHRLLTKCPSNRIVDHINRNGVDNRRCNLRIATTSNNTMNCKKYKSAKTSKYKGVVFHKYHKKYSASIGINGKRIYLGYFNNEIDAALAYNKAALKYFGEFSRVNEI